MFTKTERESSTFSLAMDNTGKAPESNFRMFRKNGGNSGPLVLENVAVFRSGTFRNSWGEQTTWTDFLIQSMVSNFEFLRQTKVFEDVPVRVSHPEPWFRNSTDEVVGYVTALRAEKLPHPGSGEEFSYLLANYEILDEAAAAKIEKRLYRNRSAEVGLYADNNDSEYFPVLTGFAYVDIPAVEGLNFGKRTNIRRFAMDTEGTGMPPEDENTETEVEQTEQTSAETPVEEVATEVAPVETPAADAETETPVENENPDDPEPEAAEETETVVATSGGTENFAKGGFSIQFNGQTITDPAAVQALMDSLSGAVVQDRASYVKSMFSQGRILASQKDKTEEFVTGLSIEQFAQFREIFDEAPVNPTVEFRTGNQTTEVAKPEADDVNSQVANHLRLALGEERFKATGFYQRQHSAAESNKDGK